MKKVFIIGTLFCTLLMTGCGCGKKEEIVVCKLKEEYEKYELNSTITIKYDAVNASMISIEELSTLTSDDESIREYYKTINDNYYSKYGNYYDSFIENNEATMTIQIDFDKITTDEFLELDDFNAGYLTDDKVDYNKIIDYYIEFTNYECN